MRIIAWIRWHVVLPSIGYVIAKVDYWRHVAEYVRAYRAGWTDWYPRRFMDGPEAPTGTRR
ncbi:MAG: hypothetical protein JXP37_08530 [Coriobacteriia bacterium]|nr:hypothetical protein [Coriobacteriia bacterium]